jgi:phenylacetate-CoA ligase
MINPFINPIFSLKALRNYLIDVNRLWNITPQKLRKFQDKKLKKQLKYAYTVPLYNKKYRELNIHPNDILGIDDLKKLPTFSKDDIRQAFPDGVIPKNANPNNLWKIRSSGSTGKPFAFYRDTFGLFEDLVFSIRAQKFCNINWRKDKITSFGPHNSQDRYDYVVKHAILNHLKFFSSSVKSSYQHLSYSYDDFEEKFKQINKFKPDYILAPPIEIQALASMKKKGLGKDLNPKVIVTSGGMLDKYVRSYIEDAFGCKVVDMYSSVEMGLSAFECEHGNYHVFSDYVYLEFLDDNKEPVASGEPGHVALTRFYGKGTPFIRYSGLDDILTPLYETCPCGLHTQLIKSIDGRRVDQIKTTDGKYITPIVFTRGIDAAMQALKTDKITQYQVVQEKIDKIQLLIVLKEDKEDDPPTSNKIIAEIIKEYKKIFGKAFQFEVKVVKKVIGSEKRNKTPPIVISKIKNT